MTVSSGLQSLSSPVSRGRKHPLLCDHGGAPVLVSAIPGGREAQCLVCGTLGPVSEASDLAWLALLGDRENRR